MDESTQRVEANNILLSWPYVLLVCLCERIEQPKSSGLCLQSIWMFAQNDVSPRLSAVQSFAYTCPPKVIFANNHPPVVSSAHNCPPNVFFARDRPPVRFFAHDRPPKVTLPTVGRPLHPLPTIVRPKYSLPTIVRQSVLCPRSSARRIL